MNPYEPAQPAQDPEWTTYREQFGRRRPRKRLIVGLGLAGAVVLAGGVFAVLQATGGSATPAPATSSPPRPVATAALVNGTISTPPLFDPTDPSLGSSTGSPCRSEDGYDNVAEGADVTVYDEAGVIVGTDRLEAGALRTGPPDRCIFAFEVTVKTGHPFYKIKIAGRDGPTFSSDEIQQPVELTLGD